MLARSWILAGALVALHAAGAFCMVLVLPGIAGWALGALLLALGVAAAWSRALLGAGKSVRAIEIEGPELRIELGNGQRFAAKVAERRHVSRYMVTLPLERPLRRTLLVTRDMLGAEEFRRLRIWALWGRLPGVAFKQLPA